ncbi:MAG TPA: OmpH family outer membrane protein [Candidatus Polarisedimenticolaceae bacterium]|nr:OmpH family outer membrane protein [Candidatus Polarisedimenticolaceae bacterium]
MRQPLAPLLLTLAALLLAGVTAPAVLAQTGAVKLGVFDPQRVSEETNLGKQVQTQLTGLREKKQQEVGAKQKELEELQKRLESQAISLSPERLSAMQTELKQRQLQLQAAKELASQELQLELSSVQESFQGKLLHVVELYGRDQGFTLILDRSIVPWAAESIDVTTAIVDRFNQMYPATPPPAAGK